MSRPLSPLPSLPLWVALPLALLAEAAVIVALTSWHAAPALSGPAGDVIEVSLAGEATDPEPVAEVEPMPDPIPEPTTDPEPAPEPEPEPLPPPEPPVPPPPPPQPEAPIPEPPPEPTPEPEPVVEPPPKPLPPRAQRPVAKPRSTPPVPAATARPARPAATASGRESARASASYDQAAPKSLPVAYLNNPAPAYPREARRLGQQGTVRLRVLVTAEGRAAEVQIAGSSGVASLDQAAIKAVRRWRFTPARRGGRADSAWVVIPVRFELRD